MFAGFLFGNFPSGTAFRRGAFRVSQLAQHGCQCGMRAGKVRLHPNSFPQSIRGVLELSFLFQHRA